MKITSSVRPSVTCNDFHETRYGLHEKLSASTSFEKFCSVTVSHVLLKGVREWEAAQFPYFLTDIGEFGHRRTWRYPVSLCPMKIGAAK